MPNYDYFFAFFWGLAVLGAFIGYGRLLSHLCGWERKESLGWGMQAALGMAAVVAVGGWLLLCEVSTTPVMVALIIAGDAAAIFYFFRNDANNLARFDRCAFLKDLPLWILAAVVYAAAVTWPGNIDPNDDIMCYLAMPERIAQTGTLQDPFTARRTYALGGHMFFKAIIQCVTSERTGHLPDMGIAKLIIFGILLSRTAALAESHFLLRLAFIAAFLVFPVPRISTNSSLTGVCLVLPALLLLADYFKSNSGRLSKALQAGLLLAGALTMRPTFLILPVAACGFFALWQLCQIKDSKDLISIARIQSTPWLAVVLFLLPWMILSYIDCRTPFFPLIPGNANMNFMTMGSKDGPVADLVSACSFLTRPEVAALVIPLFLVFLLPVEKFVKCAVGASLVASLYIAYKAGVAAPLDMFRFTFPAPFTGFLFGVCSISGFQSTDHSSTSAIKGSLITPAGFVAIAVGILGLVHFAPSMSLLSESISSLYAQATKPGPFLPQGYKDEYKALQDLTPKGSSILFAVDAPYLLDYKRNKIFNIDVIGAASPAPGIPLFDGPEKLKSYLQKLGINYVIAVKWDRGIHFLNRKTWLEHKGSEWFWKELHRPPILNFMTYVDELEKKNKTVDLGGNCRLIQLME